MFGYPIEPDFNLSKEQRRDRVGWALIGGSVLCIVYDFSGLPHSLEVFQACFATVLFYGANFYVNWKNDLAKPWLWKTILASIPVHVAFLASIFWSDRSFPTLMTKAIVFIPVLSVTFAMKCVLIEGIARRFRTEISEPS